MAAKIPLDKEYSNGALSLLTQLLLGKKRAMPIDEKAGMPAVVLTINFLLAEPELEAYGRRLKKMVDSIMENARTAEEKKKAEESCIREALEFLFEIREKQLE